MAIVVTPTPVSLTSARSALRAASSRIVFPSEITIAWRTRASSGRRAFTAWSRAVNRYVPPSAVSLRSPSNSSSRTSDTGPGRTIHCGYRSNATAPTMSSPGIASTAAAAASLRRSIFVAPPAWADIELDRSRTNTTAAVASWIRSGTV